VKVRWRQRDIVCEQAVALMTDYLEGVLSSPDVRRLERHLAACANCAEYLAQLGVTIELSGRVDTDDLDEATRQSLIDVYRAWRREQ
jgi:anti-sigma factor RsiW